MTERPFPRLPSRHRPVAFVLALTAVLGMATAWYLGAFTSNGRFARLDACALLPPPDALASLVPHGAREPRRSHSTTFFDWGGRASECKWSSVPAGQDGPFRTVRIYTHAMPRERHTSAEATARRTLAAWYLDSSRRDRGRVKRVELGEQGYTATDAMAIQIVFSRVTVYDLHAKFRISNALVDVSARTHAEPGEKDLALVLGLAENVARRLAAADPR